MAKIRWHKILAITSLTLPVFFLCLFAGSMDADSDEGDYSSSSTTSQTFDMGDPISAANGEYHFTMNLFDLGGPLPLAYTISHRTNKVTSHAMGQGPFDHNVPVVDYGAEILSIYPYRNDDIVSFVKTLGAWQVAENTPTRYILRETGPDGDNGYLYLMDPIAQRVYIFEKITGWGERLRWVMDRNGNQLTYSYPGAIFRYPTKIEDGLGRSLDLGYPTGGVGTVTDQAGRQVTMGYDTSFLTFVTDAGGNTTTFVYEANDKIAQKIQPLGNIPYTQAYGNEVMNGHANIRVIEQTDAYNNERFLSYNPANTDVTETRPDGKTVVYGHYPTPAGAGIEGGPPSSLTDTESNTADFTANAQEQITGITDRLGDTTGFTYHAGTGKIASITNARGDTLSYTYTAQDQIFTNPADSHTETFTFYNLTRIDYPDGTNEQFSYDAAGNMLTRVDRAGKVRAYTYNAKGQVLTATNPTGGVTTYTYNADGTRASSTDSDTGTTTYGYDAYKRLNLITYPGGSTTQIAYNLNNRVTSITDENNHTYTYTYDANGNLTRVADPVHNETGYACDLMDRVIQVTDRLGKDTDKTYDNMEHLDSVTDPNNIRTTFGYDPRGWLNERTLGGQTWQTGYDDEGIVASRTTPLGYQTMYQTDNLGHRTGITNPLNQTTTFTRDAMTMITGITDPLSRTTNYTYDGRGLLSGVTKPVIGTAAYTRNDLGLLDQITDLNGNNWTFGHTNIGHLQTSADPLGNTRQHTYDTRGRLNLTTYPDTQTMTRTYDNAGNITGRLYSGGLDLEFGYDELDRLLTANGIAFTRDAEGRVTATDNPGTIFGATYDDGGRLKTVTYNNGAFTVTYSYDVTTGLLSGVTDDLTGARIDFTYDNDRRLTGITRSNGVNSTLTYDNAARLTRIQDGGIIDIHYTLDAAGQVTQADTAVPLDPASLLASKTNTFTYDAASQVNTAGYAYDARGRLTAGPGRTCAWDGASRVTGIDGVTLAYNGLDDLVTRTGDGTTIHYYYNNAIGLKPVVAEKNETTAQFLRYYVWTPGGSLLYMIDAAAGNKVYFYHFDRTGSTLALTGASGAVTDSYAYTPYGELLRHNGTSEQPFTFVGKWGVRQEGNSGNFYHMRARYYDAATARFVSRDPIWPVLRGPENLNPYQYAKQNPLMFIDLQGTSVMLNDLSMFDPHKDDQEPAEPAGQEAPWITEQEARMYDAAEQADRAAAFEAGAQAAEAQQVAEREARAAQSGDEQARWMEEHGHVEYVSGYRERARISWRNARMFRELARRLREQEEFFRQRIEERRRRLAMMRIESQRRTSEKWQRIIFILLQ